MTVFSIIKHFIEFLVKVNLILENYANHFVFIIIHLGTTEFLLRCKKPYVLLFLHYGNILKLLCSRGTIYHSSGYFKEKLNIIMKPLKASFTNKISPYIRWCVSPLTYFFTTTNYFDDNKKDESGDEESNPDESKDNENEENVEETSDQSEENATDSTETYIDFTTALSESTLPKTPHKRKSVTEEKNVKRPRSSNIKTETSSFENTLLSHLEMEAKSNDKENSNLSLPNQKGSNNRGGKMPLISIPGFNETTSVKLTHDVTEEHPQNSETTLSQQVSQISQGSFMTGENPCGNESLFSVEGTDKSSLTMETPGQSPSPDNRFQELVSSSDMAQDWEILPSELFTGDKTLISGSHAHKKFRRSQFLLGNYQSMSEDTCKIESRDSACFDTPTTSGSTFQRIDNKLQKDISNKDVSEEISSKSIKCHSKKNPIETSSSCGIDSSASTDEHLCTYKNAGSNTKKSTTGHQNSSDSTIHPWDRPGCSKDPEYYPHIQNENNNGSKSVEYCRSYPGLTLQHLKVKKDAIYQKKFYKQKKEIILPVKMAKIIRWAAKVSKNVPHNVPRGSDPDKDKLPLDQYHKLAQELVQRFMNAYNSAKEKVLKTISDKKLAGRKQQKEKNETGYTESSFQEESPSSDFSDDDVSLRSQESTKIATPSSASPFRPSSETNLSKINVSPIKPMEKVQIIPLTMSQANYSPDEISKGFDFKSTIEEQQIKISEGLGESLSETSKKMICTKPSETQQIEIFESPHMSSISKGTVNRDQLRDMFEDEQRAILESLSCFSAEKSFKSDCEVVSQDHESKISKSSSSVENLNRQSFADNTDAVQIAMLESLGLTKQPGDSEDIGFTAVDYEIPKELNIYETEIFSEEKSWESSTYREYESRTEEGGPSTSTKTFLRAENITDSFVPTLQTEFRNSNVSSRSGLTQFPIIIDVRHKSSSESENEETCPPLFGKDN